MQGIKISVNYVGARLDIALIIIMGYVDTTTCQELAKVIQELIKRKYYHIITDLRGGTYISSAGWGVFMGEIKNVRDKGGDIKVVQMNPEVFEVFEMLEFNRILNYYDSVEEAIDEFDIIRGINITEMDEKTKKLIERASPELPHLETPINVRLSEKKTSTNELNIKIVLKDLPLVEKVKRIILENPFWGIRKIIMELKTEKYGNVNINWLQMYILLKKINLETRDKRYRFYRSK
jgi:anti-anti-sigma factor